MFVEFANSLFLQYSLRKEQELHKQSHNKQAQWETHDTINIGLYQVSPSDEMVATRKLRVALEMRAGGDI